MVAFLNTMKKLNRIKKSPEFQEMIKTSKKMINESFVFYYCPKKEEQARIGITLSKKMGHAVDRNKYKRQVRMMFEELVDFKTYQNDVVVILRYGYKDNDYSDNKKNLEKLLIKSIIR